MCGFRSVWEWWSVMMTLSTPSPANCMTRSSLLTRESALAIACTWWSEETKPVVSMTCAICALTTDVPPAETVTGASYSEYSAPREI